MRPVWSWVFPFSPFSAWSSTMSNFPYEKSIFPHFENLIYAMLKNILSFNKKLLLLYNLWVVLKIAVNDKWSFLVKMHMGENGLSGEIRLGGTRNWGKWVINITLWATRLPKNKVQRSSGRFTLWSAMLLKLIFSDLKCSKKRVYYYFEGDHFIQKIRRKYNIQ